MAKRRYEVDPRVLSVFFFVAIPFVAFGALVVISHARMELQDAMGSHLEQRAVEAQQLVERYVIDQYAHLHVLSLDPQVRQAVTSAPQETTSDEGRRLDQAWSSRAAGVVSGIVDSPLASRLRELGRIHPALKLLQVVDARGHLVASTGWGGRIRNAEATWFRALSENASGTPPYVVDVIAVPPSSRAVLEIGYPLRGSEGGRLRGAVRALFDVADLYSVIAPVRVGRTGHAVLMRAEDGLILAADESSRVMRDRFPGFQYFMAAQREDRRFWVMPEVRQQNLAEPRRMVAFARVEQLPAGWIVAVEQDLEEAIAPIRRVSWYLFIHFAGVMGTAVLLALYFSLKLEQPVIDERLHLHEEHLPRGAQPAA